jgi:hypothetical protein
LQKVPSNIARKNFLIGVQLDEVFTRLSTLE